MGQFASNMRQLFIFGGAFDPVHYGHLRLIHELLEKHQDVTLLVVPTVDTSVYKSTQIEYKHRCAMLSQVLPQQAIITDIDNKSGSVNSFESIKNIESHYPDYEYTMVIGDDNLLTIDSWESCDYILNTVHLLVANRTQGKKKNKHDTMQLKKKYGNDKKYKPFNIPVMDICSSSIRSKIKQGLSTEGLIHYKTAEYISMNGLYVN